MVDRSLEPRPGRVVVAVVAGEMTIKRLHRLKDGRTVLKAEHPDYPALIICEEHPAEIWGVVVGSVRKMKI